MIHIDVNRIPLTDIQQLIDAAKAAQAKINEEKDPDLRREVIKSYRLRWVAFRNAFERLSYGKCWYTESKNPGTDDDIDHFRPKGAIDEDEDHGGYYWKALDWNNFRLSCHRANRLRENPTTMEPHGKSDHFPLLDPSKRAKKPQDSLLKEQPLLLDPCNPFDPPKLTFNSDGTTGVAPKFEDDDLAVKQVNTSRVCLHLDWPAFVDDRTRLYNKIAVKINQGIEQAELLEQGNVGSKVAFRNIVSELINLTRESEPYSAAAIAYLFIFRTIWWVRDVVLRIPPSTQEQI